MRTNGVHFWGSTTTDVTGMRCGSVAELWSQRFIPVCSHLGGIAAYQTYPWSNIYGQLTVHQRNECPPAYPANMGGARDIQAPSSTLPHASFFTHGPSHTDSQRHSISSTTTVLPPVSTLRPARLRTKITPSKAASLSSSQVSPTSPESPPVPPTVKIEYDSPQEIHSHFHCDFSSPIHF